MYGEAQLFVNAYYAGRDTKDCEKAWDFEEGGPNPVCLTMYIFHQPFTLMEDVLRQG